MHYIELLRCFWDKFDYILLMLSLNLWIKVEIDKSRRWREEAHKINNSWCAIERECLWRSKTSFTGQSMKHSFGISTSSHTHFTLIFKKRKKSPKSNQWDYNQTLIHWFTLRKRLPHWHSLIHPFYFTFMTLMPQRMYVSVHVSSITYTYFFLFIFTSFHFCLCNLLSIHPSISLTFRLFKQWSQRNEAIEIKKKIKFNSMTWI